MNKPLKQVNSFKPPLTGLALMTIQEPWARCRWIDIQLLRPQGIEKPISFMSDNRGRT